MLSMRCHPAMLPLTLCCALLAPLRRPTYLDIALNITDKFVELHGDRAGFDDPAMVCGIGSIEGVSFMFIGHQKGRNTKVGGGGICVDRWEGVGWLSLAIQGASATRTAATPRWVLDGVTLGGVWAGDRSPAGLFRGPPEGPQHRGGPPATRPGVTSFLPPCTLAVLMLFAPGD